MQQHKKFTIRDLSGNLGVYFNWSANALMPVNNGAADHYLKQNRSAIWSVAQKLLKRVNFQPGPIFRGVLLKEQVTTIVPNHNLQYLSFSTDRSVAKHFSNIKGFGSEILDLKTRLGRYGYIIEYTPKFTEVLFHYRFLSILPYKEGFDNFGADGQAEVDGLKKQKEVMIFQPTEPFTNITPNF